MSRSESFLKREFPALARVFDHWVWECSEPEIDYVRNCLEALMVIICWSDEMQHEGDPVHLRGLLEAAERHARNASDYLDEMDERERQNEQAAADHELDDA